VIGQRLKEGTLKSVNRLLALQIDYLMLLGDWTASQRGNLRSAGRFDTQRRYFKLKELLLRIGKQNYSIPKGFEVAGAGA